MSIWTDYQKFTRTTAIYADGVNEFITNAPLEAPTLIYLPLGLADEAGELAEKISAFTARAIAITGIDSFNPHPVSKTDILKEVGDVVWYCARILDERGIDLSVSASMEYLGPATLDHIALEVATLAGRVAGRSKKYIRDGAGWDLDEKREKLYAPQADAIVRIIAALKTLCRFFGTTLEHVLHENQQKLQSRKDRGVLQGDGDNR